MRFPGRDAVLGKWFPTFRKNSTFIFKDQAALDDGHLKMKASHYDLSKRREPVAERHNVTFQKT
jgi:hypothetical protein